MNALSPLPHDPASSDPAALYALYLHHDHRRPGYAEAALARARRGLPRGAAVLDRSGLYPRESLAGTVESVRPVDAVVLVGKRPRDKHTTGLDPRIDLDPTQREIAELALESSVAVLVMAHDGELHPLERCRRTDVRGGMRLVPPEAHER